MNRRSFLKLLGSVAATAAVQPTLAVALPDPAAKLNPSLFAEEIGSGYIKIPGGLIVQWGVAGLDGRAVFPLAMSSTLSVNSCANSDIDSVVLASDVSNTGCLLSEPGALWMVIGQDANGGDSC